jgi:hypothetical protein
MSTDPAFLSARDLLVQFRARTPSPLEALEAVLKRLAADNPEPNAFHLVDVEMGRRMAKDSEARWMKGEPIGALDGVPVPIKDTNGRSSRRSPRPWPQQRASSPNAAPSSRSPIPALPIRAGQWTRSGASPMRRC